MYIGEQSHATVSGNELSDNTANTFGTTGNGGGLCSLGAELLPGVPVDIDGLSRPYGSGYDLGADEYGQRWVQLPLALRGGG